MVRSPFSEVIREVSLLISKDLVFQRLVFYSLTKRKRNQSLYAASCSEPKSPIASKSLCFSLPRRTGIFIFMSSSCFLSKLINTEWKKHRLSINKGMKFLFHCSHVNSNSEGLLRNFRRCLFSGSLLGPS